jgi:hypothetical protein
LERNSLPYRAKLFLKSVVIHKGINLKDSILEQAYALSEEILKNIELTEIPLTNIALKTSRLARLLNDFEHQKIFQYEASGYPTKPGGVPPEIFALNQKAKRTYFEKDTNDKLTEYATLKSIEQYESELASAKDSLQVAIDANISIKKMGTGTIK